MNNFRNTKFLLLITLTLTATLSGCFYTSYRKLDHRCKTWVDNHLADRSTPFILESDDIDTMYEKYICYNSRFHHWTANTTYLQKNGKETISLISSKLNTILSSHELTLIIFLLRKMQYNNDYNVAEDAEILEALNAALIRINKKPRGTLSALWLREIEFASPRFTSSYPFTDKRCAQWTTGLFCLNDKQFEELYFSLETNTQYAILLCKLEHLQLIPSQHTLRIATRGEQIIPFLIQRLESTDNVYEIILVFNILIEMHSRNIYIMSHQTRT